MGQWTEWLVEGVGVRGENGGGVGELHADFLGPNPSSALARSVTLSECPHPCNLCFPLHSKVGDDKVSVTGSFSVGCWIECSSCHKADGSISAQCPQQQTETSKEQGSLCPLSLFRNSQTLSR